MSDAAYGSRTLPGLDHEHRSHLVVALNQALASLSDLAMAYKQAHWNVLGGDFSQLHGMFDQFADQTLEYADVAAERAVALGGHARGTVQAAVSGSSLPAFPLEERDATRLLLELVGRVDILDADLRQLMAETVDEAATQDVYVEIVRGVEKQRWMLQAHLVHRAS